MDRCPHCKSDELGHILDADDINELTGSDDVHELIECSNCGHVGQESEFWATNEELGLSPDYCEACGHRRSFGCGHRQDQEVDALNARLEREAAEHEARKVAGGLGRVFV